MRTHSRAGKTLGTDESSFHGAWHISTLFSHRRLDGALEGPCVQVMWVPPSRHFCDTSLSLSLAGVISQFSGMLEKRKQSSSDLETIMAYLVYWISTDNSFYTKSKRRNMLTCLFLCCFPWPPSPHCIISRWSMPSTRFIYRIRGNLSASLSILYSSQLRVPVSPSLWDKGCSALAKVFSLNSFCPGL